MRVLDQCIKLNEIEESIDRLTKDNLDSVYEEQEIEMAKKSQLSTEATKPSIDTISSTFLHMDPAMEPS